MKRYILILICGAIFGCSSQDSTQEPDPSLLPPSTKVEIFAARGQLGSTLYEKYVLSDNSLWRECGTLTKSPSIQINPVETQADIADEKALTRIRTSLAKLMSSKRQMPLPAPDTPFGLSSAGAFEMTVTKGDSSTKLTTSVDAVSGAGSSDLQQIKKLFSAIRSVGQGICGGGSFFGI